MADAGPSPAPGAGAATRRRVPPVVLVGMMGTGKSTVGRRLASRLERPFVDADDELVRRSGLTVREWFAAEGEAGFRRAEADLLADLLSAPGPAVIAAGGGVVVTPANREALAGGALVVWLRADVPFLVSRLNQKDHRPLLDEDPAAALGRLHAERSALYAEVADLVIDVEPFHAEAEKPKRQLAARLAEMVLAAEGESAAEGTAP